MNRRIIFWYIILMASLISCVSCVTTSRSFSSHGFVHKQAQIPQPHEDVYYSTNGADENESKEEEYRAMSRIGSRPPNCGHKCEGCFPCEAVQIPTNTDRLSLQIANYEPEGWKCKCGLSFFNP